MALSPPSLFLSQLIVALDFDGVEVPPLAVGVRVARQAIAARRRADARKRAFEALDAGRQRAGPGKRLVRVGRARRADGHVGGLGRRCVGARGADVGERGEEDDTGAAIAAAAAGAQAAAAATAGVGSAIAAAGSGAVGAGSQAEPAPTPTSNSI